MDNEASKNLRYIISNEKKLEIQLVPPHQHRRNAAERAIRTAKNHLLAGIASCDPTFPINEWDRLILQAELTLNLLRTSRVNNKLSAWAYLNGVHDFNKYPLAPPGTKVIIHKKPSDRKSWQFHGEEGFYIAPALNHYRCLTCYIPKTRQEKISDTVTFISKHVPIPESSV